MALGANWQKTVRQALTPPVKGNNIQFSGKKLIHSFPVFLNKFGSPPQ
jgi:hypothetical protein